MWFDAPCPSAALAAYACAVSWGRWGLLTRLRVLCVLCAVSVATWGLFTVVWQCVRDARGVGGIVGVLPLPFSFFSPLLFFCCFLVFVVVFYFLKREDRRKGTREHYWHRQEQLKQHCSTAVFLLVCVAGVISVAAPQGCSSGAINHMSTGYCQYRCVSRSISVKRRVRLVGMTRGSGGFRGLG